MDSYLILRDGKTKANKLKNIISAILMFLIISGSILAMFIIAANKSEDAQLPWTVILLVAFIQDVFVSPIIFMATQFAFIFSLKFANKKNKPKLIKFIKTKIDENMDIIYVRLDLIVITSKK